ncbi:MAG: phenylalanine--tRNA ligase subunit beta [Planctomycetes bacterium]|nr:phenylalanine--tRNA ligase subunit beta [Planctomycetota bacterium]
MLINTTWLNEYIEPKISAGDIIDILPKIGLEIESTHILKNDLADIRIGFIRKKNAILAAPAMFACEVEVAKGRRVPIVCASEHEIEIGWGVPVALAGTRLPHGRTITAGQFHGVESQGMICLDGELGFLATGTGLQVFKDEATLGQSLTSLITIEDCLLDLNVLPNRPDCLGHIGVAREVAAATGRTLRYPETKSAITAGKQIIAVDIQAPDLCPRYSCQLIRNVKVGPSPAWLKSRLLAIGCKPINNIVDITNYVMYEWGQPLHAFDYAKLQGDKIVVRRMKPDEKLELLSGKTIDGTASGLVIADAVKPVALAGIMGGRPTATESWSTDVLLEAANFEPVNIRKSVKAIDLGLETRGTASSYRFERGTDPNSILNRARERAADLICELAGGSREGGVSDSYPKKLEPRVFKLTSDGLSGYLGVAVDAKTIKTSLERLEMKCSDDLTVEVPTWRVDVNDPVVLIEDVARQLGFDSIVARPNPGVATIGIRSPLDKVRQLVTQNLVAGGFLESRNPPLESADAKAVFGNKPPASIVRLSNPSNREMSVVRCSLFGGLLRSMERNIRRGTTTARLFEIDRIFWLDGNPPAPKDRWMVAGVVGGMVQDMNWRGGAAKLDFFDLKGVVENVLDGVSAKERRFEPVEMAHFVPGTVAAIKVGGQHIGCIGEFAPGIVDTGKMQVRLFGFELDLQALVPGFLEVRASKPPARMPAVTRDLAIVVAEDVPFESIEQDIRGAAGAGLESLRLVDVYHGSQIPKNHKSLAMAFVFREHSQTLTAEAITAILEGVMKSLKEKFAATLRA